MFAFHFGRADPVASRSELKEVLLCGDKTGPLIKEKIWWSATGSVLDPVQQRPAEGKADLHRKC